MQIYDLEKGSHGCPPMYTESIVCKVVLLNFSLLLAIVTTCMHLTYRFLSSACANIALNLIITHIHTHAPLPSRIQRQLLAQWYMDFFTAHLKVRHPLVSSPQWRERANTHNDRPSIRLEEVVCPT